MNKNIPHQLTELRLIPIAVIDDADHAVALASTLRDNGCCAMEVTFRTEAALASIARILREVPGMLVGASTLLTVRELRQAQEAGAAFGVAPGFDPELVACARDSGMLFIPGVSTASEMSQALARNCLIQKFFPAEDLGGVRMLQSLMRVFRHTGVRIVPTGGISAANAAAWLEVPEVIACGASWICERSLIASSNWDEIGKRTREALAVVRAAHARCGCAGA